MAELAQKGKVPLAYITGKYQEFDRTDACDDPADYQSFLDRLDLADR